MKVLLLGGVGLMSEGTARDLLEVDSSDVSKITIADIDYQGVNSRIEDLNDSRINGATVDIYDKGALIKLMADYDVVINAAPTETTFLSLKAALEAQVNIITLVGPMGTVYTEDIPVDEFGQVEEDYISRLDKDFREVGITGIMGLGSAPGTSNVLGRYLGDKFDTIESMEFSYAYAYEGERKTLFAFAPRAMINQYIMQPMVVRNGKPVLIPPRSGRERVKYINPIGIAECFYIRHSEATDFLRHYREKGIKNIGTKAAWGQDFLREMDFLYNVGLLDFQLSEIKGVKIAPVDVVLSVVSEKNVTVAKGKKNNEYGCVRLKIKGKQSGQILEYTADVLSRPYKNLSGAQQRVGIPAAIGSRMIARNQITRKGCFTPDYGVDPKIYFRELAKRNIESSYTIKYLI